jgi:hypothetical protein
MGRELKLVFIYSAQTKIVIKTAYEPDEKERQIYKSQAKR